MFKKEQIQNFLYLDVETVSAYPSIGELAMNDPRGYKLWKKRELYYKTAYDEMKDCDEAEIYLEKAGLEPEFSRIVCISFGTISDSGEKRFKSFYGDDEKDILEKTIKVLNNASLKGWKLCGHNIKGFDIPCIGKRLIYNKMPLPASLIIWDKKPWELPFIDTTDVFAFGSWSHQKYLSLDLLSSALGIPSPKVDMDGSMVNLYYWKNKDYEGIKTYCESDVNTVISAIETVSF